MPFGLSKILPRNFDSPKIIRACHMTGSFLHNFVEYRKGTIIMKNTARLLLILSSLVLLFGLFLIGCKNDELDNKVDTSKLPPTPADGSGPKIGGAVKSN
jgi:hypothetical protein